MIFLSKNLHFALQVTEQTLESVATVPNVENLQGLLSRNEFDELIVSSKITSKSGVLLASGKWGMLVITVNTKRALFVEPPGVVRSLAGSDKANVDFLFVPTGSE